jgi:hypothetical protein
VSIKINSDGTFAIEYEGPYQGLDVQKPETLISDKASPSFNNFMLRNAELRSRPQFIPAIQGPTSLPMLGIASFMDINGIFHTVTWAGNQMYQYNPLLLPAAPWSGMVGAPGNMGSNPVSYQAFANSIYYTNSSIIYPVGGAVINPFLAYWNGLTAAPVYQQTYSDSSVSNSIAGISLADSPTVGGALPGAPTITGPMSIGGKFLAELNNQLILANIAVLDQGTGAVYNFPNLIWWSANGLPLQWDPTQNTSAGENPFLDVPDQISGLAMLGVAGYIFRTNGITQMSPTGSSAAPWEFDHMWASKHGIGNVYPWSVSQYGPNACFVAQDNIYSLSITNAQPIGGAARDAIMADIASAASQSTFLIPYSAILPIYVNGYVYLTYNIYIPFINFIRNYVYSMEDQNWAVWDLYGDQGFFFPPIVCAPDVV